MCSSPLSSSRAGLFLRLPLSGYAAIFSLSGGIETAAAEPALSPALASLPAQLKIATYNVENYGAINRRTPHGFRTNYPKSEAAKRALRQTIREIDADILVLQEMGPIEYLFEFQRDLKSEGIDYPYSALMRGPDERRHIAALSRVAFADVHEHSPLRFTYQDGFADVKRGLLELHVETAHGPLTLWAVHLKSRYTDNKSDPESAIRRAAEARRIREFIVQRIADTDTDLYLILGDFNDTKASPTLRYFMQRGNLNIFELLPTSDSHGEYWTYHNARDDTYWRVDHILVSPALSPFVRNGSAQIANGPQVRAASDHRPISVTLDFSALPAAAPNREVKPSSEG